MFCSGKLVNFYGMFRCEMNMFNLRLVILMWCFFSLEVMVLLGWWVMVSGYGVVDVWSMGKNFIGNILMICIGML